MINAREVGIAPSEDEVEVALLGPGYGESIVAHFGQGEWLIVDSCINDAREPQALEYLRAIGVEPDEAVSLIVATHWHDDHRCILAETGHAYLTSRADRAARPKRRDRLIERSIREANITMRRINPRWGGVRLRRRINATMEWSVTQFGEAHHLRELVA